MSKLFSQNPTKLKETKAMDSNCFTTSLQKLLDIASEDLNSFQDKDFHDLFSSLLVYVIKSGNYASIANDFQNRIHELLQAHKDSIPNVQKLLNAINSIQRTATERGPPMPPLLSQKCIYNLTDLLFQAASTELSPVLIECLKLHIRNSKDIDLLTTISSKVLQVTNENMPLKQIAEVMIGFSKDFDTNVPAFFKNEKVNEVIQKLLLADSEQEEKYGVQLLNLSKPELECSDGMNKFWDFYLQAMNALIEDKFEVLKKSMTSIKENINRLEESTYDIWLNVFLMKMLKSKEILINRLAVEWILDQLKCVELDQNLFKLFTDSLKNLFLYDFEGNYLPQETIGKFLDCNCTQLLQSLAYENWKPVAFHFWLRQLSIHKHKSLIGGSVSKELVMEMATRVRTIENARIRKPTISIFEELFNEFLTNMNIVDHIMLLETLYKIGDYCSEETISFLLKKFSTSKSEEITAGTFSKHLYEILCINFLNEDDHLEFLIKILMNLQVEKHGWLRFLLVFHTPSKHLTEIKEFCQLKYELDLKAIVNLSLKELSNEFRSKLVCQHDEAELVNKKSFNFFAYHRLNNFSDLADNKMSIGDLLEHGDYEIIEKISALLQTTNQKLPSKDFELLLKKIQINLNLMESAENLYEIIDDILIYIKRAYPDEKSQIAERFLDLDGRNPTLVNAVSNSGICLSKDRYKTGILSGEPKQGEERIEEFYTFYYIEYCGHDLLFFRYRYIESLYENGDVPDIVAHLLKLNKEISEQADSIQELSREHHQQVRVTYAICALLSEDDSYKKVPCSSELWEILLNQKQRPSEKILYEIATAFNSTDVNEIKEQLKMALKYEEESQLSVISVAFNYCILRFHSILLTEIEETINLLHPLTMNANSRSRLFAQLAIILIIEKCIEEHIQLSSYTTTLLTTLKLSIGDKLSELCENVRFKMASMYKRKEMIGEFCEWVYYLTNEPYDEYFRPCVTTINMLQKTKVLYEKEYGQTRAQNDGKYFKLLGCDL